MTQCYYRRLSLEGDTALFDSTDHTRSNWTPEIQHGSPPLALLTKAIEETIRDRLAPGMRIGRLALDILGPIPVAEIHVRGRVERPGRRIALLSAEMSEVRPEGKPRIVARVSAWALSTSDTSEAVTERHPPLVEGEAALNRLPWKDVGGYVDSVQWRPQTADSAGATVYWLRPLVGLVDDEPTTALQRMAMIVDSANGVGAVLDSRRFVFMNTDTTVHLHRLPMGEDFALRARASIGPDGIGVTTAEIFDRDGFVGTSAQTLLVQRRE